MGGLWPAEYDVPKFPETAVVEGAEKRASARSRPRASYGPAAPDRSSRAASISRSALGLARGRSAPIRARYLVDAIAVDPLRAKLELESLAHNTGKKAAHRMLLPSRDFHDGSERCALRLPQHAKDGLLFSAAAGWTRNAVTLRRSFGANLAACRLGFTASFAMQHL
jgi:hypothetical protein